jgi:hypothetical protein
MQVQTYLNPACERPELEEQGKWASFAVSLNLHIT